MGLSYSAQRKQVRAGVFDRRAAALFRCRVYPKVMVTKNAVKSEADVTRWIALHILDQRGEKHVLASELLRKYAVRMHPFHGADRVHNQSAQAIELGEDVTGLCNECRVAAEAAQRTAVR